ncbi:RE2 [Symbiodinium sp. CCMP2456]|nr:RE2 [Symbiodinium sp. CCMP2456]
MRLTPPRARARASQNEGDGVQYSSTSSTRPPSTFDLTNLCNQLPEDADERTLAELLSPELRDSLPPPLRASPGDHASQRAIEAAKLDPILSVTEADRRKYWLRVDPDLRKCLRDLHVNFGHPTNVTLQRLLRRQGARPEAIRAVDFMSCDSCGETHRRKRPKPVRLPNKYIFNNHLQIDVFYAKDIKGQLFGFLNVVCDATGFQVVSCLGSNQGPPSTKAVLRHFLTAWSSWAGLPNSIQVDRGKEYLAHFSDYLKAYGVEQEAMALEAPWKLGRAEKGGGLWKEVFQKVVHDQQVAGLEDVVTATAIVTQTRNAFPRTSGYAPNSWVLGQPEVRLPGSLLLDNERERLEVLEGAEDPRSAMARTLNLRESAKVAQIKLDTDGRVRRALLHQSTPTRGPYPVGSYVYFFRAQAPPGTGRTYRWHGPARVIGVELRNSRRTEDQDLPTAGGQPHSYWLRYGASVILVTGEQLRFASEDELLAAHMVPQEILEPPYARGARNFVDLRAQPMLPAAPEHEEAPAPLTSPRTRPASSSPMPTTSSAPSVTIPGTAIQILPEFLPPVPEDDDGGLLDEIGQATPRESQQNPRTGGDQDNQTIESGQATHRESKQNPRTGGAHDLAMSRQASTVTSEPEPQPTTQVVPVQAPAAVQGQSPLSRPNIFADLNRLDGYAPNRTAREPVQGPYMVEPGDWDCPTLPHTVREANLRRMAGYFDEFDNGSEEEETVDYTAQDPADVLLTGKAVKSEIKLEDLGPDERKKFEGSMAKEWSSWQLFEAADKLTPEQRKELPDDVQIIGTRWVHTDKNAKPRMLANYLRKRTGKTKEQINKEFPFEPKSRIVVQGCQEDPTGIRSDSPTASLLAFNLVCAISVLKRWTITACDASTAYLQSKGISRTLILRPPRPPPPGISPHDLLRARGSIYGTKDAGRAWWKKLYKTLKRHSWLMSRIEAALFYLVEGGRLIGVMISHVDDLYCTGEGERYETTLNELEKELHLKIKRSEFRFCGKNVKQTNGAIELDQYDAIEGVDYMLFSPARRKEVNAPLTEEEKSQFRGLIGQMGWITRQSRPDLMVNVSLASQTMGSPKVKDVINLNKAVKMLKETSDAKWRFVPSDMTLENARVFCFADSSFANTESLKSQCGYLVGLTTEAMDSENDAPILILETYSGSIKRVCRSTLAAEANGLLAGVEAAEYLQMLMEEIMYPEERLVDISREFAKEKVLCYTDAKSLEAALNKDAGQSQDKRREPLLDAMNTGTWRLAPTEEAKHKKLMIRAGRHARKAALRVAEDG